MLASSTPQGPLQEPIHTISFDTDLSNLFLRVIPFLCSVIGLSNKDLRVWTEGRDIKLSLHADIMWKPGLVPPIYTVGAEKLICSVYTKSPSSRSMDRKIRLTDIDAVMRGLFFGRNHEQQQRLNISATLGAIDFSGVREVAHSLQVRSTNHFEKIIEVGLYVTTVLSSVREETLM